MSNLKLNDNYYLYLKSYDDINFYKFKENISYGYFIRDIVNTNDIKNNFEFSNLIYNTITGNNGLFEIIDDFDAEKVINKTINISGRKRVYLEIFNNLNSFEKVKMYDSYNIYVNGNLYIEKYPNSSRNGVLDFGTFEDEKVNIKIENIKSIKSQHIEFGLLNLDLFDKFIMENKVDLDIKFNKNKININIESNEENIIYLPLTYLDGYKLTNNGKKDNVLKVFNNYVGIKLEPGVNNIVLIYEVPGLKTGALISIIGIVLSVLWIKYFYKKESKLLLNVLYYSYLFIYFTLIIIIYLIPSIMFLLSFI